MSSRGLAFAPRHLLAIILLSYAVTLSIFVDTEQRNYLVLFCAAVGGIAILPLNIPIQQQTLWALLLFSIMIIQALFRGEPKQIASLMLTFLYAAGYFSIAGLIFRIRDRREFLMNFLRKIIFGFAIVSVLQMAASLAGLPVPNQIASKGIWSYNSLAYEPSQLGRVVGMSMLCYLVLARLPGETEPPRVRQKLLIAFAATMLLSGSSLAFVAIILVYVMSRSSLSVILIVVVGALIWPTILQVEYEPIRRAVLLLSSLDTLDLDQILDAEHSGGIRLAPFFIYLRDASPAEAGFWFGYGADGLVYFFRGKISGVDQDVVAAGFLPGFGVVYGSLIFGFFVWVFVLQRTNRTTLPLIAFWAIFMTTSAWNAQVFWYGLILIQIAWLTSRDIVRQSQTFRDTLT